MSENNLSTTEISFSMPDQLGTVFTVGDDSYEIHSSEGKLTDRFLDELLQMKKSPEFPKQFTLYDDNEQTSPVELFFSSDSLTVKYSGNQKDYPVSFDDFFTAFTENVKKYAIYYAAPCNYRAMFFSSFDTFVARMEKYRDGEKEILKKFQ